MRALVPRPSSNAPQFSKKRRHYLEPIAYPKDNPRYEAPPFTNNVNLVLPLRIIAPEADRAAQEGRKLVFHSVGDSGGIHGDETQIAISEAMEQQINSAAGPNKPAFFYHLGDVIYFNGQSRLYNSQFYEPYKYYPAPIFAIPGNHDGDTRVRSGDAPDDEPSLYGFIENFCAQRIHNISPYRGTMTQPYVYWRLTAPLLTIIGLYSNVEGTLDSRGTYEQQKWLEEQLQSAKSSKDFTIVAVHHPPYSLDRPHGGTPDIAGSLDHAFHVTGMTPHMVISGHVHNYQRFTRHLNNREIPYIVDGRGGYANSSRAMHKIQNDEEGSPPVVPIRTRSEIDPELELTLDYYNQDTPGFLRFTVSEEQLRVDCFDVPFVGGFKDVPVDSVAVTRAGKLVHE